MIPYAPSPDHKEVNHFLDAITSGRRKTAGGGHVVTAEAGLDPSGIAEVRLENVGPFVDLSLELDRHWNILLGNNGVGKSNILRAIAAGLCGRRRRHSPTG